MHDDVNASNPYLLGPFAPVDREVDSGSLRVTGELPRDLAGVFARNGPNPKYPPRGAHHWFDGDGMVHAVTFRDGQAFYRNRWVQTPHLAEEDAAGRALWSGVMEPTAENPRHARYKDTANTDVAMYGGDLLATWYVSGAPQRLDPHTLDTIGPLRVPSGLRISAHAKSDDATGELVFFEHGMAPPYLRYGVLGADGAVATLVPVELQGPRLPHDLAITRRHSIVMDLPMCFRAEAATERRWLVEFRRDLPARFAVLPRHGDAASIRWFDAETCYVYHAINAWEEDGSIVMIGCRVLDPLPRPDPSHGRWSRVMANLRVTAHLHRWRFDLSTGLTHEEPLGDENWEFPTMNTAWRGVRSRYAWLASLAPTPTLRFDGLARHDHETGERQRFAFGPGRWGSEAPFAQRAGGVAEDDGYVVTFVTDEATGRSEVLVLDARDLAAGPVATVHLPQRVPLGFHACWIPADRLPRPTAAGVAS